MNLTVFGYLVHFSESKRFQQTYDALSTNVNSVSEWIVNLICDISNVFWKKLFYTTLHLICVQDNANTHKSNLKKLNLTTSRKKSIWLWKKKLCFFCWKYVNIWKKWEKKSNEKMINSICLEINVQWESCFVGGFVIGVFVFGMVFGIFADTLFEEICFTL